MRTTLRGGLAGWLAALTISLLWFVDYGPGNNLHTAARWLMLDSNDAGRQVGVLLLLVLGELIGGLFGLVARAWRPNLGGFLVGSSDRSDRLAAGRAASRHARFSWFFELEWLSQYKRPMAGLRAGAGKPDVPVYHAGAGLIPSQSTRQRTGGKM